MDTNKNKPRPWQYSLRSLFRLTLVVALLCSACVSFREWYVKWRFPFGWSHCCDIGLMFALRDYANGHGGAYPAGECCPEASLSLLYPKYLDEDILRGKTIPLDMVEKRLKNGQKLTASSCGWHYVEGLTKTDDPRLGLIWDKVGLGHNGERLSEGGHNVIFVNCISRYIKGKHWDEFEQLQEILLLKKKGQESSTSDLDLEKKWRSIINEDQF